ncbi:MAG: ABC transporter substrate-binding protein [Deltaproteobacteria bacterium]|nr:ABC transporter substrate-binding protein [Deltaproteobacteria bacterium]
MRNKFLYLISIIIIFLISAVLVTMWLFRERHAQDQPVLEKLNVGITLSDYSVFITIADSQGFFTKNGLTVNPKQYQSGSLAYTYLLQGEVDVATMAESALVIRSFEKGFDQAEIGILSTVATADIHELIARKDRGIEQISDLKGKKIGISRKTSMEFFLTTFLILNHLSQTDVTIVDLSPPKLVDALANGEIDAVLTWDVYAYQARDRLGKNAVSWPAQSGHNFFWLAIGKQDTLISKAQAVERFLKGLIEAEEFVKTHNSEAKSLYIKSWNRDPAYGDYLWPRMNFHVSLNQSLIVAMEDEAKIMVKTYYSGKKIPSYFNMVYTEALGRVNPKRIEIFR